MSFLVVGGGKMGISHLAVITQYVGKANVALVERKLSVRLLWSFFGYRAYSSAQRALEKDGKPEGVVIASPTSSHEAMANWAIANRLPFFVEKPLTLDVRRSAELVEAADEAGVPSQMGFVLRYIASFRKLRALASDGRLGALRRYRASMQGNVITQPPKPGSWLGEFASGGGCLNEYGPHIIDLCRFIFGEVDQVDSAKKGHVYSTNADDWVEFSWRHGNGVQGDIKIDWCNSSKRKSVIEFVVEFDAAIVRVDNSAIEITWNEAFEVDAAVRAELGAPPTLPNVGFYLRGEEFSLEMEDFIGSCRNDLTGDGSTRGKHAIPQLEDGYAVDRLIDQIAQKVGLK